MIITCVNCNKNFDVDTSVIPENGRLLQCNSCKHKWFFKKNTINETVSAVKINIAAKEPEPLKEGIETPKEELEPLKEGIERIDEEIQPYVAENTETIELLDKPNSNNSVEGKIITEKKDRKEQNIKEDKDPKINLSKNNKNYSVLSLTILFIISFISLIIVLDTFQGPISKIVPNIEFLLYNLYETINDIVLFFKDLI
tara:strand:+ start:87 stop:683 length:597 start_codon:yes stop_codon:yes gene_type:complete